MMLGLIAPSAGTVRLFGRDPQASVKALEGVAGFVEAPSFYPYLNGRTNLDLLAALDGDGAKARIPEALEIVGLADRASDRVGAYSHGMRQRLGIAAALVRQPRLLLLDEPATGLDPGGMRDMRDLIRDLSERGMTVLLSSHLLGEVEDVCNRVAIVRQGGVAYQGSLAELRRQAGGGYLLRTSDDELAQRVATAQAGIEEVRAGLEGGVTFGAESEDAVGALSLALSESGALIRELSPRHASLEDLFFRLTEGEAAGAAEPTAAPVGSAA
jgi:ABC-2 type transport system ATP-binding protein